MTGFAIYKEISRLFSYPSFIRTVFLPKKKDYQGDTEAIQVSIIIP